MNSFFRFFELPFGGDVWSTPLGGIAVMFGVPPLGGIALSVGVSAERGTPNN